MNTYVLYNPEAGNKKGYENSLKLYDILREDHIIMQDVSKTDVASFIESLSDDERVILSGGDGTLNHFINSVGEEGLKREIYYYASGSGNDFRADTQIKDEPFLLNKYLVNLPTVVVKNKKYKFINGIGYGIDGYCCEEGDRLRECGDGKINYVAIAVKGLLFHYKPTSAQITVDGVSSHFKAVWLAPTMKGRYYGGGMLPTPNQNRFSQEHEVSLMVFHGGGKLKALSVFPSIFKGEHVKHSEMVKIFTGNRIKVEFDRLVPLQIDGETISDVSEYEVTAE